MYCASAVVSLKDFWLELEEAEHPGADHSHGKHVAVGFSGTALLSVNVNVHGHGRQVWEHTLSYRTSRGH